jgi:hypothetical protein
VKRKVSVGGRLTILDRDFSGKIIVKKEVQAHQMEYGVSSHGVSSQGPRGACNSESGNPQPMHIK